MSNLATILLVEDDQFMLDGIRDLLEVADIGYDLEIFTAQDGKAGLQVMAEYTPDLIVSDITMPQMDGFEFLARVRQNPEWVHIPLIFLTARGKKQEIHLGKTSGANLYITKPFHMSELQELIKIQLDRTFELQKTRQHKMDNLKKNILKILNHEFRTPLTYVTAYYDMLADSLTRFEDSSNFREYLQGIQGGCIRLTRLIEDFILVLELQTGEIKARYDEQAQPIDDLAGILQEAIDNNHHHAAQSNVQINYTLPDESPALFGVRKMLVSIFGRLIHNAIKFTYHDRQENGIVDLSTTIQDDRVQIAISDKGVGIPTHVQERLFEPFFQYNRELLEQQGAGIGLTIAQGLVDLHQGYITIESVPEKRSTFTVVLPIYESDHPVALPKDKQRRRPVTVLIVEDNQHLLLGLKELLELFEGKYQFEVLTATNGTQGLEMLATHQPHLIISDIMMPQMDGYTFLKEVRENPKWLQIPFVFLTAKGERRDIHFGLSKGVEEYITKPYDSDQLLDLVISQLDRYFEVQGVVANTLNSLKHSILNLVSFDFRPPLSSVAQYSEKLAAGLENIETDQELKKCLKGIQAGSIRLTRLVEDFISLAELKTGETETAYKMRARTIKDMGVVVCEAAQMKNEAAAAANKKIHCEIDMNLPAVFGVAPMLSDNIQRLLEIAIRHDIEGDIILSPKHIDRHLHITVHFSASLSSDQETKIQTLLRAEDETGLSWFDYAPSLKIVRGQVALHNGRVQFHHAPPQTYIFTLILPLSANPSAN